MLLCSNIAAVGGWLSKRQNNDKLVPPFYSVRTQPRSLLRLPHLSNKYFYYVYGLSVYDLRLFSS